MPGTSSSGGRNAKSRQAHALAGTGRKDRGTTTGDAPEPPKGEPTTPAGLRGYALAEWTRMVARLAASKTLSTVDDAALYQYCCLWAETEAIRDQRRRNVALVKQLQAAIATLRDGEHIVEAIAQIVKLKQLEAKRTSQLRMGHMALRQYLVEFGMTPAARSRVKVPEAEPPIDPFAEFDTPEGATH